MLRLNEDCLMEIFKRFHFAELLNLTRVCKRFEEIAIEMIFLEFGRNGVKLSSKDSRLKELKLIDYKQFFKVMSRYIHTFNIEDTNCSAFSSYLERYAHRPSLEFFMSLKYDSLVVLDCQDFKLNDSHMRQLANSCKLLRKLTVKSQYITGQHIESFKYLELLQFLSCNVQKRPLQRIVTQLPLLHFELIDNITDVNKALADSQIKSITSIEITDPNFGLYFAAKPSLRYLVVYDHPENLVPEREASIEEEAEPAVEGQPVEAEPVEEQIEGLAVDRAPAEEQRVERHLAEENPLNRAAFERQPEDGQPLEAEPVERQAVQRQPAEAERAGQAVERQPEDAQPIEPVLVEGQAVERQPEVGQRVEPERVEWQAVGRQPAWRQPEVGQPLVERAEGLAIERHLVEVPLEVGAPEEEQRKLVKRLRLYPHLTVWFQKRVKYIEAPRDYDIFESMARIVTQLELPSTNPPNLHPVIAVVKFCRKLEVLKLELNDYNCDNLEELTELCVRKRRDLRVYLHYREGRKSKAVKNLKMWRSNSSLYKSQTNIALEFIIHSYPRARHLFSFKFI